MKDVFDKAKSAVKQTVDTAKQDVSSGGMKALLTKKNIIIAVVAAVIVIGGLSLIFGGGGGSGDNRLVGRWEIGYGEQGGQVIVFSRNGTYEFRVYNDLNAVIHEEQGRWRTHVAELTQWEIVVFYERRRPDGGRIAENRGRLSFSDNNNILRAPSPNAGESQRTWNRVR